MSQNYAITLIAQILINQIWQYNIRSRCYMRLKQSHHNIIWDWVQNVSKLCHNINCTNHNKQNMAIQHPPKMLYEIKTISAQ